VRAPDRDKTRVLGDAGVTANAKPKPGEITARTAARIAAVQALYQMDLAGTDLNDVIAEFLNDRLSSGDNRDEMLAGADRVFFADILRAVVRRQREIDPIIDEQLATGWRLVRVDSILRAILRGGVAELLDRYDVPARVAISEYVNVARVFFDEDEPRVVNGILDKLARRLRTGEFEKKPVTPS
jgi:N utilization substance protein B